jgi:threonylcarbamoyladenosine tRNA methylthiotransferase MtaB
MVGFPNETSEMFLNSIDNLKQIEFSDMHIFPFSKRENTLASSMINVVMNQEKTRRFKLINNLKKSFKVTYLNNFINHIVNVLFEQSQDCNFQSGHSEYFFTVKVKTSINLTNELLKVKITSLIDEQLFGVLV